MQWMFGAPKSSAPRRKAARPQAFQASTQFVPSQSSSQPSAASSAAERKELLRVVLRDTLNSNGIPLPWISADALTATSAGRPAGTHIRLLIKHWDPRLAHHALGFQQDFEQRLLGMDPMSASWLMGVSWQYALPDNAACPPLPEPASWAEPAEPAPVKPASASEARADLERLLAARDADMQRHAAGVGSSYAPTQPAPL